MSASMASPIPDSRGTIVLIIAFGLSVTIVSIGVAWVNTVGTWPDGSLRAHYALRDLRQLLPPTMLFNLLVVAGGLSAFLLQRRLAVDLRRDIGVGAVGGCLAYGIGLVSYLTLVEAIAQASTVVVLVALATILVWFGGGMVGAAAASRIHTWWVCRT